MGAAETAAALAGATTTETTEVPVAKLVMLVRAGQSVTEAAQELCCVSVISEEEIGNVKLT